jgi:hypothetical protein
VHGCLWGCPFVPCHGLELVTKHGSQLGLVATIHTSLRILLELRLRLPLYGLYHQLCLLCVQSCPLCFFKFLMKVLVPLCHFVSLQILVESLGLQVIDCHLLPTIPFLTLVSCEMTMLWILIRNGFILVPLCASNNSWLFESFFLSCLALSTFVILVKSSQGVPLHLALCCTMAAS